MSFFIWTRKTRRNNQRNTEISLLFRDPSLTHCPPTTDPWAGHTVLSQGGPDCPPFLKKGNASSKLDFFWKDHLVFFECCVYHFLLKTGGNPFVVFLNERKSPWLEAMEKTIWRTWTGTTFYLLQRQAIWSVLVKMWGFSSEPKLWWFHHQFLKGYIPEN